MDSDDDHEESTAEYRGVPATIVLINVFDPNTGKIAYEATCRMIRQYLRQSRNRYVGVSMFGVDHDDGASMLGDKNVIDIFPLKMPTLEDYKMLINTKIDNLKRAKELEMSSALLHCSKLFANCKKQLSSRTVIMLLRLDTPPVQMDQMPALTRVEDLAECDVYIKLIHVAEANTKVDDFYKDFLINANQITDDSLPKPSWDIPDIEKQLQKESHRHLAVAKLDFEIGNGMYIGVGVYSLLKDSGKCLTSTYLDRESNNIVKSVIEKTKVPIENSRSIDFDVQQIKHMPVLKSELIYSQEYGGERVEFTDAEIKYLKNPFGPPMIKLLGFKPASLLSKEKWFFKKGYFLFPNEGIIEGSTVAFKALHQACVETGMVAICILCTRVNSKAINVALSPSTHPLGLSIDTGFDVINIPFVENIRNMPKIDDDDEEVVNISNRQKTVMKGAIKAITFDYKPEMFEDPKMESLYRGLEAIALHEEDMKPFVDTTKPNSEIFSGLDHDLFQNTFSLDNIATSSNKLTSFESAAMKRSIPHKDGGNHKKVRIEETDESLLQSRIRNKQVNQYTVGELKQILKSKDIPQLPALTGLKKVKLVELVYTNFEYE